MEVTTFDDRVLKCIDCAAEFVFSASEQQFFAQKQLKNVPKRCPSCRMLNRYKRSGNDASKVTEVQCDDCGAVCHVPFRPKGHKPTLCTGCFHKKRGQAADSSGEEKPDNEQLVGPETEQS
ncbi:MAG TPA: zinc-ribbon domain containing protein [Candidatus Obscuribacterales bacterium]